MSSEVTIKVDRGAADRYNLKQIRQFYCDNAINLTAAKIVLTKELRNLDATKLEPILNLLWEDLAHAIMKTYSLYNCANRCFMLMAEWQRHDCYKGEPWGRKQFAEAVMNKRDDMIRCTEFFFSNILK